MLVAGPLPRRSASCASCLVLRDMPPPLPRRKCWVRLSLASSARLNFPTCQQGRLPHRPFRGLIGCSLALRPVTSRGHQSGPVHRRLRQFRFLHCRFDCYWAKRLFPRGTCTHWTWQIFTAHWHVRSGAATPGNQWLFRTAIQPHSTWAFPAALPTHPAQAKSASCRLQRQPLLTAKGCAASTISAFAL